MGTMLAINRDELEALLCGAWGNGVNLKGAWEVTALQGGFEQGSLIYRLRGLAEAEGKIQPWSLVLKVIQPDGKFADPQGFRYWKREVEAYRSGLLFCLPGPVAVPRCYAVVDKPDGAVWIWMEDIDGGGYPWSVEQHARVARWLGQFNGAYLAGARLPAEAWITRDWLRKYLEHAAPVVAWIRQNPAHPVVKKLLPGLILSFTLAIWEGRQPILQVLDSLPQTFLHQDAFGRNLFIRGEQVVAIDWGYAGIAPVGAELAALIGMAGSLSGVGAGQLRVVDQVCFDHYLQGLREAGWNPDRAQVRRGYVFTVLLRYILGAIVGEILPAILESDELRQLWLQRLENSTAEEKKIEAGVAVYYRRITIEVFKLLGWSSAVRIVLRIMNEAIRLAKKRKRFESTDHLVEGNHESA